MISVKDGGPIKILKKRLSSSEYQISLSPKIGMNLKMPKTIFVTKDMGFLLFTFYRCVIVNVFSLGGGQ